MKNMLKRNRQSFDFNILTDKTESVRPEFGGYNRLKPIFRSFKYRLHKDIVFSKFSKNNF
jgi:hypothetical protein